MLTRDELLGFTERRYDTVTLPNGQVARIQSLTEDEKADFEAAALNSKGDFSVDKLRAQRRRLIMLCLVDDKGQRLLKPDDQVKLKLLDGAVTSCLYAGCRKHCGFEAGEIEELVKNSELIPDEDSPTGSRTRGASSTSKSGAAASTPA